MIDNPSFIYTIETITSYSFTEISVVCAGLFLTVSILCWGIDVLLQL